MERLDGPLDGADELDRPESEPGLGVIGIGFQDIGQGGFTRAELALDQESLRHRRRTFLRRPMKSRKEVR